MSVGQPLLFETCELGVSSAVAPELLPPAQLAWGMNIDVRGGKPSTRPNLRRCTNLPAGLIQGAEFFSVQGGMIVCSIAGRIYRLRINAHSFAVEEIPLAFVNSSKVKQVWMTQTVESLVIQDGQSNAILYNGSIAKRAVTGEVPRGKMMAYGNGRLWVAINSFETVAGDIRTSAQYSELNFTEATYLTGGGRLFFPRAITGMAMIPLTGQADYGALMVFGAGETHTIRADITSRDDWGKIPGFVANILRSVGASSQWSIVSINQDLYWRDSNGGIRSIRNALADETGPGSAPVSREVSRLTDFDSTPQLQFCSGIYFDNRLLMTSSPFLMQNTGVGFKNLISLDFAPLSTMGGKSQPAYNGQWNGLNFVKLVSGQFNGKNRAFALTTDDAGNNQLWEFGTADRADIYATCPDGTSDGTSGDAVMHEERITSFVEYPLRSWGESKTRKRLTRTDVWLSSVNGDVDLKVYWRADNSVKWNLWDEASTCAKTSDPATNTPHVWKNLVAQERPQFKTFTIPDSVDDLTKYAKQVGFEFQIRLVWTGRLRIHRVMVYAQQLDDPDFADRTGFEEACVSEDIGDNQVTYEIPTDGCPFAVMTYDFPGGGTVRIPSGTSFPVGGVLSPTAYAFSFCNNGPSAIHNFNIAIITGCPGAFDVTVPPPQTIHVGECASFEITFYPEVLCPPDAPPPTGLVQLKTGDSNVIYTVTLDDDAHPEVPSFSEGPIDFTVDEGGDAFFASTVSGTNPIAKQWQVSGDGGATWNNVVDDENYSGARTDTLAITDTPAEFDANVYRLRGTNEWGARYSDEAVLTVGNPFCPFDIPTVFVDGSTAPYADLAAATAAMAADVPLGCMVQGLPINPIVGSRTAFSSAFASGILSIISNKHHDITLSLVDVVAVRVYLTAADGLSVDYNVTASPVEAGPPSNYGIDLWADDQLTLIDGVGDPSPISGNFSPVIPSDGYYWLVAHLSQPVLMSNSGDTAISLTASGGPSFLPCTARAAYGAGPSYLDCS